MAHSQLSLWRGRHRGCDNHVHTQPYDVPTAAGDLRAQRGLHQCHKRSGQRGQDRYANHPVASSSIFSSVFGGPPSRRPGRILTGRLGWKVAGALSFPEHLLFQSVPNQGVVPVRSDCRRPRCEQYRPRRDSCPFAPRSVQAEFCRGWRADGQCRSGYKSIRSRKHRGSPIQW